MRAWWHRRRAENGLGEIVGGVGGLLLLVFLLTGALSVFRLWQTHQVLDRAATVALRSEEQQGCWTAATNAAVAAIIQQGGLSPKGVAVTRYTGLSTRYGQPVSVALAYAPGTDFLFGGAAVYTEQAGSAGSSFYVPTQSGSSAVCTTPQLGVVSAGASTGGASGSLGPTRVTLAASPPSAYTGQVVTLTVTANASTGSQSVNIVDTTTGQTIRSCADTTSCSVMVTHYTQNTAISRTYSAEVGSSGATTGSVSASPVTVTWNPVAHIEATRWWSHPTNTTLSSAGVTWPNTGDNQIWWAYAVSYPSSSYQGWSQGWDAPDLAGAAFGAGDSMGFLGVNGLPVGLHHVVLTFYFANGAIQELVSPPVNLVSPTVSLAAGATTVDSGQSTTLTATADFPLTNSGYALNIENTTTGQIVGQCTTGTTCPVTVSQSTGGTVRYQADIGPPGAVVTQSGVLTTSPTVTVRWVHSWSATSYLLPQTGPLTLMACVNGFCQTGPITVPPGTPVALRMTTSRAIPQLNPTYLTQNSTNPYWTGFPGYNGASETVTGPRQIVADARYGSDNTGSGTGTAYFQLWPQGAYGGQGSNIVEITWQQ